MERAGRLCGPSDTDLAEYLRQIRGIPMLTPEEERLLSARWRQQGCQESRERMVCGNLRLVVHAARRYAGLGVPMQDLIEAGNVGLLHAVQRFNPDVGARFASYAVWWIRRGMVAALSEHGCLVQLPRGRRQMRRLCREVVERLRGSLGRPATHEEVASATGLSIRDVTHAQATPSVTALAAEEGEPDALATVGDARVERPDQRAINRELGDRLRACVRTLPSQEAEIVRLHFGLGGRAPLTLKEIGREMGLPDRRADRLLRAALGRLQLMLHAESPAGADRIAC